MHAMRMLPGLFCPIKWVIMPKEVNRRIILVSSSMPRVFLFNLKST